MDPNSGLTRANKVQSDLDAVGEVADLMSASRRDEHCLALGSSALSMDITEKRVGESIAADLPDTDTPSN